MKYVDEYRNGDEAQKLAHRIRAEADPARAYRFMEFCGGHTHVLSRWGLTDLLPENVRMIHGPGCPVCVMPIGRIDMAMALALNEDVILCTYADTMRVPASKGRSFFKCRAEGADIRMIYSPMDAVKAAVENPDRQVVFFAIGFETTTPPSAAAILAAKRLGLKNFSVFCNHVLTPAAMEHILLTAPDRPDAPKLQGLVGPAHVSAVIGSNPYLHFSEKWRMPVVVCGFEPLDMLLSILMLVRQVNDGRAEVENEFTRAVTKEGNLKAIALMAQVFEPRESFEWRGLGRVPKSALKIRPEYAEFDAEKRFVMPERSVPDNKACECGAILRGEKAPKDCRLFGRACTPAHPIGACMVSSEGACAAYFSYGRHA
ncbi:hydrogenase formation protein HypD [Sutterella sp.]|uniref:hydrogenase formation protein HypD n=1 Tax=Sutterella sp. TaxID=1981025 RepID=UPI003FD8ADE6